MAITSLPAVPQRSDPTNFATKADAFLAALPTFVSDANTLAANLNSIAAGGAYAIPFTFTGSDVNVGGASGFLAVNNGAASQSVATSVYVDLVDSRHSSIASLLNSFNGSTSVIKGTIRITKVNDPSKWLIFTVSAITQNAYAQTHTVTCVGYSSANPFTAGDSLIMFFQRAGDKGDTGTAGANGSIKLLGTATVGSAVANIDFLNSFSDTYPWYRIELDGINPSATDALFFRFAIGGVVDTAGGWTILAGTNSTQLTGNATAATLASNIGNSSNKSMLVIDIRGARNTSASKGIGIHGFKWDATNGLSSLVGEGAWSNNTAAVSGFRLFWSSGSNFTTGTVRVYGYTNT